MVIHLREFILSHREYLDAPTFREFCERIASDALTLPRTKWGEEVYEDVKKEANERLN